MISLTIHFEILTIDNSVACDFIHVCLLAGLIEFFHEQGQMHYALHTTHFLRQVCNVMGPEYDVVSVEYAFQSKTL